MTEVLRHVDHFMQSGPPLVLWTVTLVLVAPGVTLLHELGHAAVARLRVDGAVRIRVGGDPPQWQVSFAGIDIGIRPLFVPFGFTGACEFEAGATTVADAVLVALAGPAASGLGALVAATALGSAAPGTFIHALLWQATAMQTVSTIVCLLPLRIADRNGVHRTDGYIALDAVRGARFSLRTTSVPAPAPVTTEPAYTTIASPACATCTHPRSEHVDLVTGRRGPCRGQDYDFQTLAATVCACTGYVAAG